jgi:hypothetical protein
MEATNFDWAGTEADARSAIRLLVRRGAPAPSQGPDEVVQSWVLAFAGVRVGTVTRAAEGLDLGRDPGRRTCSRPRPPWRTWTRRAPDRARARLRASGIRPPAWDLRRRSGGSGAQRSAAPRQRGKSRARTRACLVGRIRLPSPAAFSAWTWTGWTRPRRRRPGRSWTRAWTGPSRSGSRAASRLRRPGPPAILPSAPRPVFLTRAPAAGGPAPRFPPPGSRSADSGTNGGTPAPPGSTSETGRSCPVVCSRDRRCGTAPPVYAAPPAPKKVRRRAGWTGSPGPGYPVAGSLGDYWTSRVPIPAGLRLG